MRLHVLMSRAQIIHLMTAVITVVSWAFAGLAVEQKKSKKSQKSYTKGHKEGKIIKRKKLKQESSKDRKRRK